ncbi:MAG: leucyl aminopeptidase [Planctomycetota bacterium]|jgi:leucyl aminopeptidase
MKEIIDVQLKTRKAEVVDCKSDLLVLGHFSDTKGLDRACKDLDKRLDGAVSRLIELGDFKGKEGTSAVIYGNDSVGAKRILFVGLGEKKKATLNTIRKAAAIAANKAVSIKAKILGLVFHRVWAGRFELSLVTRVMAEGVFLGSYRYDEYVTESKNGRLAIGKAIGGAHSYARTIANRPGNVINPPSLAAEAKKMARGLKNVTCTVFDDKQLVAKKMGGILAVGSGSVSKPRLIILKYSGGSKAAKRPTVGLVGKAITFDSGGISIKPAAKMEEMKLDKSGGIAVLATIKAIADLGLGVNVLGIIPSAENLPSSSSYRPGDIVTTYSGKTVEVQNTDAEGRMVLCDGLCYADKQNCDVIIDVATLTGACKVALGKYMAALMSNDDKLVRQLQAAAKGSGEKVWHMPSGDEYADEMKSKIADLKNIGSRWGGACTAAAFLRQFVGDRKWAHLDIAGVEMFETACEFSAEGSSGFGVRLLTSFLMGMCKK